jgi:hypothetical protein
MLTETQLASLKVGDMLLDLTTNKMVKVCGCLFVVRNRIGYVREHPEEFTINKHVEEEYSNGNTNTRSVDKV